jgi:hypothetical protein
MPGFAPRKHADIRLTVQTLTLRIEIAVAGVAEKVDVPHQTRPSKHD